MGILGELIMVIAHTQYVIAAWYSMNVENFSEDFKIQFGTSYPSKTSIIEIFNTDAWTLWGKSFRGRF